MLEFHHHRQNTRHLLNQVQKIWAGISVNNFHNALGSGKSYLHLRKLTHGLVKSLAQETTGRGPRA